MFGLPVAHRELTLAARLPRAATARTAAAFVTSLVFLVLVSAGVRAPSRTSPGLFHGMAIAAFGLACAGGLLAADAVSSERRQGTLGLLLLADLGGAGVVVGKLFARGLNAALALAAVVPVLGLCWIVGGVTPGEFLRTLLALANALFLSLAIAIWVSSRRSDQGVAYGETCFWIGFVLVLGVVHRFLLFVPKTEAVRWWLGLSPWVALRSGRDTVIGGDSDRFWSALGLAHAAAWVCLAWAARAARRKDAAVSNPKSERAIEVEIGEDRRSVNIRRREGVVSPEALDADPVATVIRASRRAPAVVWVLSIFACAARLAADVVLLQNPHWHIIGFIPLDFSKTPPDELLLVAARGAENAALTAMAAAAAILVCRFVAESREEGAFELLLTTGLGDQRLFSGLWTSLRSTFAAPLALLLGVSLLGPVLGQIQFLADHPSYPTEWWTRWFTLVVAAPLRLWAAGAFGVWAALGGVRPAAALRATLFWAVLGPGVGALINPWLGAALVLGFAQHKLRTPLRELLEQRHA
jgi:ABC-2 family transporter protein